MLVSSRHDWTAWELDGSEFPLVWSTARNLPQRIARVGKAISRRYGFSEKRSYDTLRPTLAQANADLGALEMSDLEKNYPAIQEIVRILARRKGMDETLHDEFASYVNVRIVERGEEIFSQFKGESSLRTYLTVVLTRMQLDFLRKEMGRPRPSAEAKRRGDVGIKLDMLMHARGLSVREAVEAVHTNHDFGLRRPELETLAEELRQFRSKGLADTPDSDRDPRPLASQLLQQEQEGERQKEMVEGLMQVIAQLDPLACTILKMRFIDGVGWNAIQKVTGVENIYRKKTQILKQLNHELSKRGFSESDLTGV